MTIKTETPNNPMGLDGFAFVEFASEDSSLLKNLFIPMGFTAIAHHPEKHITLYQQGHILFLVNEDPNSFSMQFAKQHGPCAASMGFCVSDPQAAFEQACAQEAKPYLETEGTKAFDLPAIEGIGGSLLYFADKEAAYLSGFETLVESPNLKGHGLGLIDHLTHNVYQGRMDHWADFYIKLFNFFQIRYFDIEGSQTGLISRAMASPCGKIKIPLNESKDDVSQIEEYLKEYRGEGIQHIALTTENIYETVESLREAGLKFLTVPDTYYEVLDKRLPGHGEDIPRLQKNKILMDGDILMDEVPENRDRILLQIFTQNVIGPIFFEIIQRKGNDGFGEGNFTALFESIERDQIRRGVLKEEVA